MPTALRRHRHPRRWRLGVFCVVAFVSIAVVGPAQAGDPGTTKAPTAGIDPALAAILDQVDPSQQIAVVAILREQVDPRSVRPRAGKRRDAEVVAELKGHAVKTQRDLRTMLAAGRVRGDVTAVEPLWIVNGVGLTARPATIRAVARRPEVAAIVPDRTIAAPPPAGAAGSGTPVEPNIARIAAPALWDLGIRGEGVVIASMDTGVDVSHPDLAGRLRSGPGGWFDPYGQHATPADVNGHGTQTMGVMVGGDAGGTAIGVAPGATWIAARIFNDSGVGTSTAVHLAFQWVLDPDGDPATADAPFVVNESWAMGAPGCNLDFAPDLEALVAAGITPVFAAGNHGPTAGSATSPGNNPGAFAVGTVDNADAVLAQSSRGPTECGRPAPVTYPAVVAPGINIVSADLHGMYATSSGTSVSAPHVSGALALLHQAFPTATPAQLLASLTASAVDLGTAGPDDTFGAGRVDVMAAYTELLGTGPSPTPTPVVTPEPTVTSSPIATPTTTPSPIATPTPTPTPAADVLGPLTGIPIVAPSAANGAGDVALSATFDDTPSGGSSITGGEWFADVAGIPGSGHALDGPFGSAQVTASGVISTGDIATLADGVHPIAVRGRDAAGNWGPISTTVLVVDRVGPNASNGRVTGTPTQGATSATLTATIVDAASQVDGAEWFIGTDPGPGAATALDSTDGAFDGSTETVHATIPLAGRPKGETVVRYRGRDSTGTWGPLDTVTFMVTPSDAIFADGFESGSAGRWTGRTGSNRLAVVSAAAMAGQFGIAVTVRSGTGAFVSDSRPKAARAYNARFGFDSRRLVTFGKSVDVFTGIDRAGRAIFRLQYRRGSASGAAQVRIAVRRAGGTSYTRWATLAAGPHSLEVGWRSGRSSTIRLWLDGVAVASASRLDTHASALEVVRLGPSAGLTSSMRGELRFDRFVSTRGSTIGP